MAKTSTLVVVISTTGGAGFSRVVDTELRGTELMVREVVKGCEAGADKVQDLGMVLLEAAQVRLPGIPLAETMGAATQVVRPDRPAVKVSMLKVGVLALVTIRGDLGLAMVQPSVGTTTIMVVAGAFRTASVLLRMVEWHEGVLMLICFSRRCMRW
jgi:hypothetical protein